MWLFIAMQLFKCAWFGVERCVLQIVTVDV